MTRKEVLADGVELYLGDCREILPSLPKVDAVVTDPPYGIDGGRGTDSKMRQKGNYLSVDDTEEYIANVCVPAFIVALGLCERAAVTTGQRCFHLYPRAAAMGCFYHPASVAHGPWGFVGFSPILYYGRDYRSGLGSWPTSKTVTEAPSCKEHPCAKPQKAWEWLAAKVSDVGETILDPFMGSGTTGVAAVKLGRKFIGIEIELKYFDIACRRISEALKQGDLFIDMPAQRTKDQQLAWDEMWSKPFDYPERL